MLQQWVCPHCCTAQPTRGPVGAITHQRRQYAVMAYTPRISCTLRWRTAPSPFFSRGGGCLNSCITMHRLYILRTVYPLDERHETLPVHTSTQRDPCHALGNYAQLLASDGIDSRRRTQRRLYRTALTHGPLRNRRRHRPNGIVSPDLQ